MYCPNTINNRGGYLIRLSLLIIINLVSTWYRSLIYLNRFILQTEPLSCFSATKTVYYLCLLFIATSPSVFYSSTGSPSKFLYFNVDSLLQSQTVIVDFCFSFLCFNVDSAMLILCFNLRQLLLIFVSVFSASTLILQR